VTTDRPLAPTLRCPRCDRDMTPAQEVSVNTSVLHLIDPFYGRYAHRAVGDSVRVCEACEG